MLTKNQIFDRLEGGTFAEASQQLGSFDSYDRTPAMIFVMMRAPTAGDRLRIFLEWWNMCDAPWLNRSGIADLLRRSCRKVSLPDFLPPADRYFYDALPKIVTVWRGCERGRERGLSWTTDQVIATGFAWGKRCLNETPTLLQAEIAKEHIFAVFTDRQENEIVLDPQRLRKLSEEPLLTDVGEYSSLF